MDSERKAGLFAFLGGLLVVATGIGIAAVTKGGYIAVGGIVVGFVMAVTGAWRFSKVGVLAMAVLMGGTIAYVAWTNQANQNHWSEARSLGQSRDAARLLDVLENSDSGSLRYWAAEALAAAPDPRRLQVLSTGTCTVSRSRSATASARRRFATRRGRGRAR